MSQWREQFGENSNVAAASEYITKWYHIPSVLLLIAFMFWTRMRTWEAFTRGGTVLFGGNDPWYHFRQVQYTVRNWPETMPYDVWTNYPQGTTVSQFGTIFDQAVATVALIIGLGDPSEQTIAMTLLFAPAVIGALITIPTYYLGKRLGGRLSGVLAALIVALSTGTLLRRGMVGSADHHVAEAFTQALAVLAIVVALQVADREKPVWELVVDRDWVGLRRPVAYGALAGVGTALYIWTWPPGVLLVGILGLYFTFQIAINYLRGESPEHLAIVGVSLFVTTAALTLLPLDVVRIATVKFSLLQPGLSLLGAGWLVFLAWLGRTWDGLEYPDWTYPVAAATVVFAALGAIALILPDTFGFLVNNIQRVLVPGSTGGRAGTVAEVQPFPLSDLRASMYTWYGLAGFIAGGGVLVAIAHQFLAEKQRSELLLVALWFCIILLASLTQARFLYYLTVPVAALTAYVLGLGVRYLDSIAGDGSIEAYQVLAVLSVLTLVVAPMFLATTSNGQPAHVLNQTDERHNGPGGVAGWDNSLQWMENNTPTEGTYAGADNEMDAWETHPKMDDYDYPAGSYGVMSWWDYGHWITAHGNRTPVANPFQQHAQEAAEFLLADTESEGAEVLANLSDGENRDVRYVMVDHQMVNPNDKFGAPVVFHPDLNESDMYEWIYAQTRDGGFAKYLPSMKQRYYESLMVRMYHYHGSAVNPGTVVTDYQNVTATVNGSQVTRKVPPNPVAGSQVPPTVKKFPNQQTMASFLAQDNTSHVGGIGIQPRERVEALDHYRLVKTDARPTFSFLQQARTYSQLNRSLSSRDFFRNPAWTKTFERVPGATIEGSGAPANVTVAATVQMMDPSQGQPFAYRQFAQTDENGNFEMTVPYSTTGYDNWGPSEGYTNTSVRAMGEYQIRTGGTFEGSTQVYYNATTNVSEAAVIGEDDSSVEVSLTRQEQEFNISSGGSSSDGSGSLVAPDSIDSTSATTDGSTSSPPPAESPSLPDLTARAAN